MRKSEKKETDLWKKPLQTSEVGYGKRFLEYSYNSRVG